MERDGCKEEETDWDSLSDRVKKSRRALQKSLLQKQRGEFKFSQPLLFLFLNSLNS